MAAFEYGNYPRATDPRPSAPQAANAFTPTDEAPQLESSSQRIVSEPILALKIYDNCREKSCLDHDDLGPALRQDGTPLIVPEGAVSVNMENFRLERVMVQKKEQNSFKPGYWDIDVRYNFLYDLVLLDVDGSELDIIPAISAATKRYNLFGSIGNEVNIATDLFGARDYSVSGDPFVMVESKGMSLDARIREPYIKCGEEFPAAVFVTLGLFSVVKLFRLVSLVVESRGFVIPPACKASNPVDPCDFFNELDFPINSFSPPQKREFAAAN